MLPAIDLSGEAAVSRLRVLIVEDEALIAWLIEDALRFHGHVAIGVADDLPSALALADRGRPDLALCDVKLADGHSGIAVAEALAERGIPSIFLSGNCPGFATHPLIVGCIEKPFRMEMLGEATAAAHACALGQRISTPPTGMTLY